MEDIVIYAYFTEYRHNVRMFLNYDIWRFEEIKIAKYLCMNLTHRFCSVSNENTCYTYSILGSLYYNFEISFHFSTWCRVAFLCVIFSYL